jgi:threonine synthase
MQYISTRGQTPPMNFEQVMMAGLAPDGGLFVPEHWPTVSADQLREWRGLTYPELALRVMQPFVGDSIDQPSLKRIIDQAYDQFDHHQVAPLSQIGPGEWLMELYHGPTLAFKDVAMQVLGRLYDHVLEKRGGRITLIGATSGDTGSAAIEAVRGREHASIFIMHPHNRTSEVQRRQMTTVDAPNVHNIAVEGTFDDCQALLKAMFGDPAFRDEVNMSGVNSINWARVMPQIVYYFAAGLALGAPDRPLRFTVPTGNFGDIYAGFCAMRMGLPIDRLVIATNVNDILTRALHHGDHSLDTVQPTMSPSMDIQVSSNFERLLFDAHGRDGKRIADLLSALGQSGRFTIEPQALAWIRQYFAAERVDEPQTLQVIGEVFQQTGRIIDPHTAVGVGAARRESVADGALPMVVLATAHPAKFPDAVAKAIDHRPALPSRLSNLYDRNERFEVLPADLAAVQQHIREQLAE